MGAPYFQTNPASNAMVCHGHTPFLRIIQVPSMTRVSSPELEGWSRGAAEEGRVAGTKVPWIDEQIPTGHWEMVDVYSML